MAVVGGEDVDTKGEQRLQGQEGQETDQVWSPAVTFCMSWYSSTGQPSCSGGAPPPPPPPPLPLLALTLAVAEDNTYPPEEECACVSEECGGG